MIDELIRLAAACDFVKWRHVNAVARQRLQSVERELRWRVVNDIYCGNCWQSLGLAFERTNTAVLDAFRLLVLNRLFRHGIPIRIFVGQPAWLAHPSYKQARRCAQWRRDARCLLGALHRHLPPELARHILAMHPIWAHHTPRHGCVWS